MLGRDDSRPHTARNSDAEPGMTWHLPPGYFIEETDQPVAGVVPSMQRFLTRRSATRAARHREAQTLVPSFRYEVIRRGFANYGLRAMQNVLRRG